MSSVCPIVAGYRGRGVPECQMRIGMDTGLVVAGSLGAAERLKYTVVGDVVVTAQRLESTDAVSHDFAAEPCRILASESTCQRLSADFVTEILEPITLKGRVEAVDCWGGARCEADHFRPAGGGVFNSLASVKAPIQPEAEDERGRRHGTIHSGFDRSRSAPPSHPVGGVGCARHGPRGSRRPHGIDLDG